MNIKKITFTGLFVIAALLLVSADSAFAQGRGRGNGGGSGNGGGGGRGLGTASTRSNGRSDTGLGTASTRSNGRSDDGLDRARLGRGNAAVRLSDNDLNRYRGLSRKLGTTPEEMRARYHAALAANPDLTYGQWVSANVVADNLGGRFPGITSSAILAGLANGDSLGRTLRNLGLSKDRAKQVERDAERRIDDARRRNR